MIFLMQKHWHSLSALGTKELVISENIVYILLSFLFSATAKELFLQQLLLSPSWFETKKHLRILDLKHIKKSSQVPPLN